MDLIKKHQYLIACIIGNIGFFWLAYFTEGDIKITVLHFFFGIVPLSIQIYRSFFERSGDVV